MTLTHPGLKRALKLRDLILLNIVAVYTPGALSQNMPFGKLGLLVWAMASLFFMLPYAAAIADLSIRFPREGGVYAWTRMALGGFHGFVCGWCYWVNTFLYVPSVFLGIVAVAALLGGAQTAWLNDNPVMMTLVAGGALWLSASMHITGLSQGKWLQNIGAFGRLAIAAGLIIAAIWKTLSPASGLEENALSQINLDFWHKVALWPFMLNALIGLDLGSVMSEEADAPRRDIPRSLLIGGSAVAGCYLVTYGAVLITGVPETNPIYGHVQAINAVFAASGLHWIAPVIVSLELIGLLGSGAAWLSAPARIPFAIGIDHYLPAAFARVHPKHGTPYVALIVQASVATVLIFINTYGATLQEAYLALLGGSIVLVMVTYIYLFISWMRLSDQAGKSRVRVLSLIGLSTTIIAMAACFIPPPIVAGVAGFELKIIGSVAFMLLSGVLLYRFGFPMFSFVNNKQTK